MAASAHTNLATATTITNNLQHDHHTCRHMAAWNGHKRHAFGADLCIKRQQMTLIHNANVNLCPHCKMPRGWPANMRHIHQTHTLCRHMAAPTHHCRHNNVQKIKRRKCSISLGHTMVLCRHMAAPQGMCMLIYKSSSSPPAPPNGPLCLRLSPFSGHPSATCLAAVMCLRACSNLLKPCNPCQTCRHMAAAPFSFHFYRIITAVSFNYFDDDELKS